jgi:diguanylate cyclase (GGDEF)-like protein
MCVLALQVQAQNYSFRNYAQADGLQGLSVNTMYEDHDGVVWAGSELGLHRFERERFQFLGRDAGIDSIYIRAITEDVAGNLWVATSNGLYVGHNGRFENVLRDGKRVPVDVGNTMVPYRDGVAVVSMQQLFYVRPKEKNLWDYIAMPVRQSDGSAPAIGSALAVDDASLWLVCGDRLCNFDSHGELTQLGAAEGLPLERWQAIFRDSHGTMWLRGGPHVFSREGGAQRFVERPAPAETSFEVLSGSTNFVEDRHGRVLTRSDNGVVRWDGSHWQVFSRPQGVDVTPLAGYLLMQQSGQLWIGTRGLGVQRWLAYDQIEHWDERQGVEVAPVWSIRRAPDGRLLLGADSGSRQFDPVTQRMLPWTLASGEALRQATSMDVAPDGAVWLGHSSGALSRRDPKTGITLSAGSVPSPVRALVFDRNGYLWIGCRNGAFVLPPGATTPVAVPGLPQAGYGSVLLDRFDRLWMVSTLGIYRQIDGRWQRVPVKGNLPTQSFSRLSVAPDGEIWLAVSDAGVWHGRLDASGVLTVQPVQDALVMQVMPYFLNHDQRGWLWVGSSQGIDLYRDGRWTRLTQLDGLLWDDLSANAFFEDHDGAIWIGSSRGVSRIFDPVRLSVVTPLQLVITSVKRDAQPVYPGQSLRWSDAPLEVELSTPGASSGPDRVSFRYRISGYQTQWSETQQSHITYPLVSSGRYVLEVQAVDSRQRQTSPIVSFPFEIFPPWWRSPFALLIYVLAGIALVLQILRWRTGELQERKRELERLVAERTQELERDKQALEAARAALAIKATRDELTGLLNRAGILDVLTTAMDGNGTQSLAVVLIDLDHFKQINDQYGHLTGDGVLARVGHRLNASLRDSDRVGRYGGEELLAVLPGLGRHARNRVRALHDAICMTPFVLDGHVLEVTCSIGVAWYREGESLEQLLARADQALYRAKHGGRARIELEMEADSIT